MPAERAGSGSAQSDRTEQQQQPVRRAFEISTVVALTAIIVIMLGLAAWFRGEANQLSGSPAARNTALVDAQATAEVAAQVGEAVQRVYSYDFRRLDEDERAGRAVAHGQFAEQFAEQFQQVRELAPRREAVVRARVLDVAVKVLDGDRAIVLVFADQVDAGTEELLLARRLLVTAERVEGSWKIADVASF